jgi:hypothetical protein
VGALTGIVSKLLQVVGNWEVASAGRINSSWPQAAAIATARKFRDSLLDVHFINETSTVLTHNGSVEERA